MAIENLSDGVGKKIVEALKMQSDEATDDNMITEDDSQIIDEMDSASSYDSSYSSIANDSDGNYDSSVSFTSSDIQAQSSIDTAFNRSLEQNLGNTYVSIPDDIDYPTNVSVLRQLISKLPNGVTKQTGAMIIKQTMEALGISMSSVLQEAKQYQTKLIENSKDCQHSISEYKKQINILESKSQKYQRQSAIMGDIINLFVHLGR